ncbi:hypothetical protein WJX74_007552 [Apatococcus lobatus]|uniref:Uncharacterized protein n=1 Tax=Apatococcus lobatus TaxID=904363 RepID=A0AAW1Q609_9CHLO
MSLHLRDSLEGAATIASHTLRTGDVWQLELRFIDAIATESCSPGSTLSEGSISGARLGNARATATVNLKGSGRGGAGGTRKCTRCSSTQSATYLYNAHFCECEDHERNGAVFQMQRG